MAQSSYVGNGFLIIHKHRKVKVNSYGSSKEAFINSFKQERYHILLWLETVFCKLL